MTSIFDEPRNVMTSANNIGEGWHPLVRDLETELNKLDPDFELQQVKEKFGGLRYYAQTRTDFGTAFHHAIGVAEEKSLHVCEVCGEPGETKATYHWLKTLCETHRAEDVARHLADQGKQPGV